MTAVRKPNLISIDDYLAGELVSTVKHEYLGGYVYAMAGGTNAHNLIATNISGMLHARLRGRKCRPFNSDTKIRVPSPTLTRFYYPDVSVICQPGPGGASYQDHPVVLVEVLSSSTRRLDEGEKRDAYLTLGSLSVLLLVEQHSAEVLVYRRMEQGFVREAYEGLEAVIPLDEIGTTLPLAEVYEAVALVPEAKAPEDC